MNLGHCDLLWTSSRQGDQQNGIVSDTDPAVQGYRQAVTQSRYYTDYVRARQTATRMWDEVVALMLFFIYDVPRHTVEDM